MFAAHFELPSPSCSLSCYGNFTPSPFQGQQQQQQRQKGSHDYNVKMSKQFQKKQKVEEQKEEEVGRGSETEKTTLVFHFLQYFPLRVALMVVQLEPCALTSCSCCKSRNTRVPFPVSFPCHLPPHPLAVPALWHIFRAAFAEIDATVSSV